MRNIGTMIDRRQGILTEGDTRKISSTYGAWRGEADEYNDIPGLSESSNIEEIRKNEYILTPDRYFGTEEEEDDEKSQEKMQRFILELKQQMEADVMLDEEIKKNLERVWFGL